MIIGVKITHDAAVAAIDGDTVVFCHEAEKVLNNPRHAMLTDIQSAIDILPFKPAKDDVIVIDGWKNGVLRKHRDFPVATYHEFDVPARDVPLPVTSYMHLHGHVVGSYLMSPFAAAKEDAYVLVWDGGCGPTLYWMEYGCPTPRRISVLFPYYAMLYGIMCYYAGPLVPRGWKRNRSEHQFGQHDWPGKIMSWLCSGSSNISAIMEASQIFRGPVKYVGPGINQNGENEHDFMEAMCLRFRDKKGYSDLQLLSLVHDVIGYELLAGLRAANVPVDSNLIFTGGAALNIKWNSLLREVHPAFWVPPCPNDSGSALGTAACHAAMNGVRALKWNVYCGHTPLENVSARHSWRCMGAADARSLALMLLSEPNEPIVFLNGKAELGPRALGNRSIIANPSSAAMKDKLNTAKRREPWRPVAPICLETRARDFFSPGTTDPYMLFDHHALPVTLQRAPAIVHEDGTARLQTVNRKQHSLIAEMLEAMDELAGLPIVANTSANYNGRGFFPDLDSAMHWCESVGFRYVFCNGKMYMRVV
jgi:carbamoyltransferase